jgi:hypothetical protein
MLLIGFAGIGFATYCGRRITSLPLIENPVPPENAACPTQ